MRYLGPVKSSVRCRMIAKLAMVWFLIVSCTVLPIHKFSSFPRRLDLELALLSPLKSEVDVTLIVTYNVARLHMLDGLCATWGGPISAVVYQVLGRGGGECNEWSRELQK